MWVTCPVCGRRHYGPYGAAGLVLSNQSGRLLMTYRSELVHYPSTWSFPGGALALGETVIDAALREVQEELGLPAEAIDVGGTMVGLDHGVWRYTYVFAELRPQWTEPRMEVNWEADTVAWVPLEGMAELALHPDLRVDLPALFAVLGEPAL